MYERVCAPTVDRPFHSSSTFGHCSCHYVYAFCVYINLYSSHKNPNKAGKAVTKNVLNPSFET